MTALISHLVHQFVPVVLVFVGAACLYLVAGVIAYLDGRRK